MTKAGTGYGVQFGMESAGAYPALAEVTAIAGIDVQREVVDATHLKSDARYREKINSLRAVSDITVTLNYEPGGADEVALMAVWALDGFKSFQALWPNGSRWRFDGFMSGFAIGDLTPEGKMEAVATFTVSGKPLVLPSDVVPVTLTDIAPDEVTISESLASGDTVMNLTGVMAGSTPVWTPNDGRFVVAGSEGAGWRLVRGLSAISEGDITGAIVQTHGFATNSPKSTPVTITVEADAPPEPAWHDSWTFSRASAKVAQNYDGSTVNFASGEKAITDIGLSLERTTTNIIPSPMNLSAWVANDGTVTSEGAGVYRFQTNTASAAHGFSSQNVSVANGGTNTAFVEVKPGGGARFVQLVFSSFGFGSTQYVNFDLLYARKGTVGAGLSDSRIEILPDGWFRLHLTAQATATLATSVFFVRIIDGLTSVRNQAWVPTGTEFLLFRGAQMAANSYPTSLFDGTRAADSLTKVTTATAGDLAFMFDAVLLSTFPVGAILFEWANAASAPTQYVRIKCGTNGQMVLTANSGGGETTVISEGAIIYSPRRVVVGCKLTTSTWSLVVNGTTITLGTAGPAPTGLTHMRLGSDNGGGAGNSTPIYVKSFTEFTANPAVAEFRELTRIANETPVYVPQASATLNETISTFQAIPGIGRSSGGRTWAVWGRRFGMNSSFGERPGTTVVIAYSDNDTTWTTIGYLVPNYHDFWLGQPSVFEAPDGSMWLMYSVAGDGLLYNGRYGVWVAPILNHATGSPSVGTPRRLVDGVGMKTFKVGAGNYVTVDVWANEVTPVHAGVTAGRFIYQINGAFDSLTLVSTLPAEAVSGDRTFDETSAVELANGNIVARWRTKSGAKQATLTGGIGGTWGPASAVSGTNAASRSTFHKGPGGTTVWAYSASAIGATRANITLKVSNDNLATEPYSLLLDSRTDTSYPDIIVDQTTGAVRVVYDRERTDTTGTGAREIIMAHGFTVAQIIAGTAVPILTVISDGSPT